MTLVVKIFSHWKRVLPESDHVVSLHFFSWDVAIFTTCRKKIRAISQLGAEKITFPHKHGWHTDRRTDICFYRVALLLTNNWRNANWPRAHAQAILSSSGRIFWLQGSSPFGKFFNFILIFISGVVPWLSPKRDNKLSYTVYD